jgi:nucleotide-binding universal stress UspA family protein
VGLAGHTRCPLVVHRPTEAPDGPVTVGVDDSPTNAAILELAFAEAAARGVPLQAVHAWTSPAVVPYWPGGLAESIHEEETHAREVVEAAIAPASARHPDVEVRYTSDPGKPASHLIRASHQSQLVVVGSRGRGGFTGLTLGSTSHAVLHHAACPVMVGPRSDVDHAPQGKHEAG